MIPSIVKILLLLLLNTLFSEAEPLGTYDVGYNFKENPGFVRYELYTPRLGKRVLRNEEVENKIQRDTLFPPIRNFPPLTWESSNPGDFEHFQTENNGANK